MHQTTKELYEKLCFVWVSLGPVKVKLLPLRDIGPAGLKLPLQGLEKSNLKIHQGFVSQDIGLSKNTIFSTFAYKVNY